MKWIVWNLENFKFWILDSIAKDDIIQFCVFAPKVFASLRSALGMSHQSFIKVISILSSVVGKYIKFVLFMMFVNRKVNLNLNFELLF